MTNTVFVLFFAAIGMSANEPAMSPLSDAQRAAWWRAVAEAQIAQRQVERTAAKVQALRAGLCGEHRHLTEDSQGEPICQTDAVLPIPPITR